MERSFVILFVIFILTSCNKFRTGADGNNKFVNPFVCTADDSGQTDPSANVPFWND